MFRRRSIQVTIHAFHMRFPKHLRYLELVKMKISWPIRQTQQPEVDIEPRQRGCWVHLEDEVLVGQGPLGL